MPPEAELERLQTDVRAAMAATLKAIERHEFAAIRSLVDAGRAKLELTSPPIPAQPP